MDGGLGLISTVLLHCSMESFYDRTATHAISHPFL